MSMKIGNIGYSNSAVSMVLAYVRVVPEVDGDGRRAYLALRTTCESRGDFKSWDLEQRQEKRISHPEDTPDPSRKIQEQKCVKAAFKAIGQHMFNIFSPTSYFKFYGRKLHILKSPSASSEGFRSMRGNVLGVWYRSELNFGLSLRRHPGMPADPYYTRIQFKNQFIIISPVCNFFTSCYPRPLYMIYLSPAPLSYR